MAESDIEQAIQQSAQGPAKASGDSGSVEQHSLSDEHHFHNIAIGDDYIYMSVLVNFPEQNEPKLFYAPKSGLLSGTKTSLTTIQVDPFQTGQHHVGCVQDYDRASDVSRFVAESHKSGAANTFIRLYAVDPPSTSYSSRNLSVDAYKTSPDSVDTPAGTDFFIGGNMKTSVLRNGHLWTAHAVGVVGENDESHVRWYEIDLDGWPAVGSSPSVLQTGTIDPPGDGVSACYPALQVDDDGNMAIAWMQCSWHRRPPTATVQR